MATATEKAKLSRRKAADTLAICANDQRPLFIRMAVVLLIAAAAMGEWKPITAALYGLPKVITVGVIMIAVAYAFIRPQPSRAKGMVPPTLAYFALIAALLLWSIAIWIMNFIDAASMTRGFSKILYQTIAVMTAISTIYLFGEQGIHLFALGLCIANGTIMLLEIPNYGVVPSIQSLITCLLTFGDAEGYARSLEIHDLTFVFGQLIIYYAAFAPRGTKEEKSLANRFLIACSFFFMVGMKRVAIPSVILFILLGFWLRRSKHKLRFCLILGVSFVTLFFLFIYAVSHGFVTQLMNTLGVDMMGRDYMWSLANPYYQLSFSYMGRGFEYVDTIVSQWAATGLIKRALAFHNDILKVFVEIGFPGFCLWAGIQYIVYPIFWAKYAGEETAVMYMMVLGYMTITYLTDNTAFYFWSTVGLKLIVLGYAFARRKEKSHRGWKPLDKEEVAARIREEMRAAPPPERA